MSSRHRRRVAPIVLATLLGACSSGEEAATARTEPARSSGTVYAVKDTVLQATFDATGTAAPIRQATLSTKLMGTVTDVLVREGDRVGAGQPLARIDARELGAKAVQVRANIDAAAAAHRDATAQVERIRALYRDSAATRAQLDAAEAGYARAAAGLEAARAASTELDAVAAYSTIRAPFAGTVTQRFVDPGAFAAPGAPIVAVLDDRQLRITVFATPELARALRRGQPVDGTVEARPVRATIEGTVPSATGNLYTINALVPNDDRAVAAGGAATLYLPLGDRAALVVPAAAVIREGDLTGVLLRAEEGDVRRWVRLGREYEQVVEVISGLRAGDHVVVPWTPTPGVAARD
jgi:RND family efflux transporter MFP subunit